VAGEGGRLSVPKVWVRVFGLRKELYEFLELWAIGSMIGSTQIVDMETTRKSDFGRILVAVLNPRLIPEQLDVVIGDHYFELDFEVEKMGIDENGEEAEFEWPLREEEAGREDFVGGGQQGEDGGQERLAKKQKRGSGSSEVEEVAKSTQGIEDDFTSWKEQVQNMSKVEFEAFLRAKANEILNKAAEGVLDELADKVLGEEDNGQQDKKGQEDGEFSGGGHGGGDGGLGLGSRVCD
jgi:hypothetical protein